MRVTQTISIGSLRINSMSNSSILQIGTSGSMKARSEDITEVIPAAAADQKLEAKVTKEVEPLLNKQGLPVGKAPPYQPDVYKQPPTGAPPESKAKGATPSGPPSKAPGTAEDLLNGGNIKAEFYNNYDPTKQGL